MEIFDNEKFNVDFKVDEIVKEMVAGSELMEFKKKIVDQKTETSSLIKSNVFKNYYQFIETAKEISRKILC